MKISFIAPGKLPIPSAFDGAIETLVTHIVDENERQDKIDISIFSFFSIEAEQLSLHYSNTECFFIKANSLYAKLYNLMYRAFRKAFGVKAPPMNYFIRKCINYINKNQFDYIICEGSIQQVLLFKNRINSKIILHVHTDLLHKETAFAREIFDSCYRIIAVSNYIKHRIVTIDPQNGDKVIVLLNAVDLHKFDASLYIDDRARLRKHYNVADNEKFILFVGRLSEGKGVKELLLACETIDIPFKIAIIGASWFFASKKKKTVYEQELENEFYKLGDRIVLIGYIPNKDISKYYVMSDIVACPSTCNEAALLVSVEALACGIPVVTTLKGGIPEYVDPQAGILIECNDNIVNNIKNALVKMLTDDDFYQRKKNYSRQSVQTFNKEIYYNNFLNILENC